MWPFESHGKYTQIYTFCAMEKDMPDINGWMFSSIAIFKKATWLGSRIFDSSWGWLTPFWALVYKPTQSQNTAETRLVSSGGLVLSGETWPCDNQDMRRCFPRKNMEQQEWWTNKYSASQWIWSISLTTCSVLNSWEGWRHCITNKLVDISHINQLVVLSNEYITWIYPVNLLGNMSFQM